MMIIFLDYLLSCEFTFCLFIYSEHVPLQGALDFALMMLRMEGGCPVDYNKIADLFLQVYLILSLFYRCRIHSSFSFIEPIIVDYLSLFYFNFYKTIM